MAVPSHDTPTLGVTRVRCACGAVELQLQGKPLLQYYCHCDDCQAVHGRAFAISLYAASAVSLSGGSTIDVTLRTTPRTRCDRCGTYLVARAGNHGGVNGELLPRGEFRPLFHMQCQYAASPIPDGLPHFRGRPARFGGSDDCMPW